MKGRVGELVRGTGVGMIPMFLSWTGTTDGLSGRMRVGELALVLEISIVVEYGCKLITSDGKIGWVNARYLEVVS